MPPFLLLAIALIPDLIKILAGDRDGTLAKEVEQTVKTTTATVDPEEAKAKLAASPQVTDELRIKLAQIALDAARRQIEEEDRKRQDALRQWQLELDAEDRRRQAALSQLQQGIKADSENTAGARDMMLGLAQSGSLLKWVPAWISFIVIAFFAVAVIILVNGGAHPPDDKIRDLLNICVGALVAGFSTVISYWLGSSQGSRDKDLTSRIQAVQATEQAKPGAPVDAAIAVAATPSGKEVAAAVAGQTATALATTSAGAKIDKFDRCITHVLAAEGGFSNNPADPGGATNFGITLATLDAWRKRNRKEAATVGDVQALSLSEAKDIYRSDYWNALRCEELPVGVDLVVFDFGVNAGPGRSAMTLQAILGVLQDGSIGPQTLHNVPLVDPKKIVHDFGQMRRAFYRTLPTFPTFGDGWLARVDRIEDAAIHMMD